MPASSVQTLKRAFQLLDCFTHEHPELGVREAARLSHLSPSTCGRLLTALKEAGIVSQDESRRTYTLGPKVLSWAGVYTSGLDIHARALHCMHELHSLTQETVTLYLLDGNDRVCVERLESPQNVRITSRIGMRLPLHAGSAGKAILAFLPPERQEEILTSPDLTRFTSKTIVDPEGLRRDLERTRQAGYAISRGEWLLDASGVAAPIFNQYGEAMAAITISGPAQRFTPEAIERYARLIVPAAEKISAVMGYQELQNVWERARA